MSAKVCIFTALTMLGALAVTLILYWAGLDGPFILDDKNNIRPALVSEFDLNAFWYVATHNISGFFGRPVSTVSFAITGLIEGGAPWGFKFHNLMLHLINGLLIFWLLMRTLPEMAQQSSAKGLLAVAGITAFAWLLHPFLVSTVLYAVQRMAQLSALFSLAALLVYVMARQNIAGSRWVFYLLAYVLFPFFLLLAILSKETGALVPVYLLCFEWLVFKSGPRQVFENKRLLAFVSVFCVLPILVGTVYLAKHFPELADYSLRNFTLGDRLLTQLHVLFFYARQILLPRVSGMGLFLDDFGVVRSFGFTSLILLLVLMALLLTVILLKRKAPILAFGLAWFFISHLMESTFIDLEMVFEHRNYLASLGLLLPLISYTYLYFQRPMGLVLVLIYCSLLGFMLSMRVQSWSNEHLLLEMSVRDHPRSLRAHTTYADYLFNTGNVEKALQHLEAGKSLDEYESGPFLHDMVLKCVKGMDSQGVYEEARSRLKANPINPYAMSGLEILFVQIGRGNCELYSADDLMVLVDAALSQEGNQGSDLFRGYLLRLKGQLYFQQGDIERGREALEASYESNLFADTLNVLANLLMANGRISEARAIIERIERIDEESSGAESFQLEALQARLAALEAEQ